MYGSWVEVNLAGLRENLAAIRAALPRTTQTVLVVKADAYGHGLEPVTRCAARAGVRWFGVAHPEEAEAVRACAPRARVVLLGPPLPDATGRLIERRITPVVVSLEHARALGAAAVRRRRALSVHLKIDTGMGRLGIDWATAADEAREILRVRGLKVEGVCTHFARVESGADDPAAVQAQRFFPVAEALDAAAGRRLFRHVSSSRSFLLHPDWDLDGVRPGIIAYGYGAADEHGRVRTRPILEWKARVVQVRRVPAQFPVGYYSTYVTPAPTVLAVVAMGYADGYLRALSNRGHLLIGGRRCRVVGRVSMNWLTVDVGLYGRVEVGDEAVALGRQGHQELWADELATLCRTIPYEVLTSINARIPRRAAAS
jgi:alanine racemase